MFRNKKVFCEVRTTEFSIDNLLDPYWEIASAHNVYLTQSLMNAPRNDVTIGCSNYLIAEQEQVTPFA